MVDQYSNFYRERSASREHHKASRNDGMIDRSDNKENSGKGLNINNNNQQMNSYTNQLIGGNNTNGKERSDH